MTPILFDHPQPVPTHPPSVYDTYSPPCLWHSSTLDLWQPSTLCTYDTHPPFTPTPPPPCAHDTHLHSPPRRSSLRSRCHRRTDTRRGCTAPSADTRTHPLRTRSRRALQQTNHMEIVVQVISLDLPQHEVSQKNKSWTPAEGTRIRSNDSWRQEILGNNKGPFTLSVNLNIYICICVKF